MLSEWMSEWVSEVKANAQVAPTSHLTNPNQKPVRIEKYFARQICSYVHRDTWHRITITHLANTFSRWHKIHKPYTHIYTYIISETTEQTLPLSKTLCIYPKIYLFTSPKSETNSPKLRILSRPFDTFKIYILLLCSYSHIACFLSHFAKTHKYIL